MQNDKSTVQSCILNTASSSDYSYHVNRSGAVQIIVIADQNKGRMSVTNNIEAVVCDVIEKLGLSLSGMGDEYHVVYRDSLGVYCGVLPIG